MSNLYGIGYSGLTAARSGLNTTGNNISNVNTDGYTRERSAFAPEVSSQRTNGVEVTGVKRQYATYLTRQLNAADSQSKALSTQRDQISQIDDLLGDDNAGIAPQLQAFFKGVGTVASNPEDISARQSLLGKANSLTARFNSFANYLDQRASSVNGQIRDNVKQVNRLAKQVARINKQISVTQARTQAEPNNLLDRRDQYVAQLHKVAQVNVSKLDNGSYQVTLGNRSIVDGSGAHALAVVPSTDGTSQPQIGYTTANGVTRAVDDDQITGGSLGGLLRFRDDSLADAQQGLNQLAHVFAATLNAQHTQGRDLNDEDGKALFTTSSPETYADTENTSSAVLNATFNANVQNVAASNYRAVKQGDGSFTVTNLDTGEKTTGLGSSFSIGGVDVAVSGGPADTGDSFLIKPVANAARTIDVAISDPAKIAAAAQPANPSDPFAGAADNRNANALAALQNDKTVEGNRSFNTSYAQLVSQVGNDTQKLKTSSDAQQALTQQLTKAQQSVSGVNLDEENINLLRFQQAYQANAKVIQTASTVFDTLLGIR